MLSTFQRLGSLLFLSIFAISQPIFAQNDIEVNRCGAVGRGGPIKNITVDADQNKWVGTNSTLWKMNGCELATQLPLLAGERSVFQFFGGNTDYRFTIEALRNAVGGTDLDLTAAFFESNTSILWLGTKSQGLFRLATNPTLKLLDNQTTKNSKLKSDRITQIFKDSFGKMWVGTPEGALVGKSGNFSVELDGYSISRIREVGGDVYVLGDGEFWKFVGGKKVEAIDIDHGALEGEPEDFDLAADGKLWILSRMVSRYDLTADKFDEFSAPEDYTSEFGRVIAADNFGSIWVGTDDKGVYLFEKGSGFAVAAEVEKPLSCNGSGSDASLLVKISGGKKPFQFKWSAANATGENPKNLSAGNFTVTVTDANGKTKSAKATILPAGVSVKIEIKKSESATGKSDGSAEARVEGGEAPLKFSWDNGETAALAQKLNEGKHSLTVTDRAGCSAVAIVEITQKALPLVVSLEQAGEIKCRGGETGIVVTVTGGKSPYQYNWSNPNWKGEKPTGVSAGEHKITVTDATGASKTASIFVKDAAMIELGIDVEKASSGGQSNGSARATARGGTGTFTFFWDNTEVGAVATQLSPGNHKVIATDANGCTASVNFTIAENIAELKVSIWEFSRIKCFGGETTLSTTIAGGKPPFKIVWSEATFVGEKVQNVPAGNFSVTVTDSKGSSAQASFSVKSPEMLVVSAAVQSSASTGQSNGKAKATARGGTGDVKFSWDTGETDATAAKLAPGKHFVTATDANGCTATTAVDISENIQPLAVSISEVSKIKCVGGTASLLAEVMGGKPPFKFEWSDSKILGEKPSAVPAGNFTLKITDAAGGTATANFLVKNPDAMQVSAQVQQPAATGQSNGKARATASGGAGNFKFAWDNGETDATAAKLAPGKHTVTATDANGCTATTAVEISENILPLSVSILETTKIKCSGEKSALSAEVAGGKPPFKFQWSDAKLTGEKPQNVPAGNYSLTISDAAGKTATANLNVAEPAKLSATGLVQQPAGIGKSDGRAMATARGGSGKITFAWDNGEATETAAKLAAGKHTCTLTDANGCSTTTSVEVLENILPLQVNLTQTAPIKCNGDKTTLKVETMGGKAPYNYRWNPDGLSGASPEIVLAGTFEVTVTDAAGTSKTAKVSVTVPEKLTLAPGRIFGATTDRTRDGKASVKANSATDFIKINWDNGETGLLAQKLAVGKHTVTATDENGCTATTTIEIGLRALPDLDAATLKKGSTVRMESLRFEADSSRILSENFDLLTEVYNFLAENGDVVIEVGGHTNNVPPDEFCDRLSTARAKAVAEYIIGKGIDRKRIVAKGYGKRQPYTTNSTPLGRQKNQRVEIKVLQIGQ